ncbi:methyltransferase family protein [Aeromicrobium sp.]|uniref:methyltransferase family protein n=1 Tax=Aeromicrobium sp. TaxID=1871063 RepID=UPI003D6B3375
MTTAALVLVIAYFVAAVGFRIWLQIRRTGDSGFRGFSGRPGSIEWIGGVLFVLATITMFSAPVAAVIGLEPIDVLVRPGLQVVGVVVAIAGIVGTVVSQLAMGASWRIGVDADERTSLVTTGVFAHVRNPIYTAMILAAIGLVMIVPNVISLVGFVFLVAALQLQVRAVEEPYLARLHGAAWDAYAARVGRFIPLTGRRTQRRRRAPR